MEKKTKYITFKEMDILHKKMSYRVINNRAQETIGTIEYYPSWRQYCFFPFSGSVWNDGCLEEIIEFIGELKCS